MEIVIKHCKYVPKLLISTKEPFSDKMELQATDKVGNNYWFKIPEDYTNDSYIFYIV